MATFSISDALGAGFDLVRRRPASVLVWGLAYFALAVLPSMGLMALVGEDVFEFFRRAMSSPEAAPDLQTMMRLNGAMAMYQPLAFLTAIAARAMLTAAVLRAVLEPQNRGFFYLRLGKDELWQALVYLCLCVLFIIAVLVALLAGGALGAVAWLVGALAPSPWSEGIQAVGVLLAVLAVVVVLAWIALRLSLAAPMTFADRTFRLFESWTLTRGQAWRLFGLAIVLGLVILALELVILALFWMLVLGLGFSGGFDPGRIEAFFQQPVETWVAALVPAVAVVALLGSLLTGALYAILTAPWAVAYRQLGGRPSAEA